MGESKPEPKPDKKRVTLRDVAEEAGVSLKTASNVINHSGRMTDSTREKVQEVIDRLGYRVNVSARNLNRGKTGFITLAVPTLTAPYLSELANRVIDAARGYGYSVYVTTYAEGSAQGAQSLLRNFNTTVSDGMILSISEVENLEAADLDVDYPLVCVGARSTHGKADHVTPTIFRKPDSQPNTCSTMAQPGSRWSDREPNRSISIPCVKQWKAMRNCDFAACSKRAPRGERHSIPDW